MVNYREKALSREQRLRGRPTTYSKMTAAKDYALAAADWIRATDYGQYNNMHEKDQFKVYARNDLSQMEELTRKSIVTQKKILSSVKRETGVSLVGLLNSYEPPKKSGPIFAVLAIISLGAALVLISLNPTGSVIGTSLVNTSWISIVLFMLGCGFAVTYFIKRKEK